MERPRVKIRGIYATALTEMLSNEGFPIVKPSRVIEGRFGVKPAFHPEEVEIRDKENKQGIVISGEGGGVEVVSQAIRKNLSYAVIRNKASLQFQKALQKGESFRFFPKPEIEVEFPANTKQTLDNIRGKLIPSVQYHHQFRGIDSARLDLAEEELSRHPEKREEIERGIKQRLVLDHYREGKMLRIEHVKPDGEVIFLSEGRVREFNPETHALILKRSRYKGRSKYDGLGIAKEEGDYAITEAREGSWILKHSYYNKEGILKGEFYNVNTPIEFYPDMIHYIDLEIDVVRWPNGEVKIVDEDDLRRAAASNYISEELANKAIKLAQELKNRLELRA